MRFAFPLYYLCHYVFVFGHYAGHLPLFLKILALPPVAAGGLESIIIHCANNYI